MGVSKIAVMAIVFIVAAPILLGYALNLNQTTVTEYKTSDESVNVTPLLYSGTAYSTAYGDVYQLNSNFEDPYDNNMYPIYEKASSMKTPFAGSRTITNWAGGTVLLYNILEYYICFDYTPATNYEVTIYIYENENLKTTVHNLVYFYYDKASDTIIYHYPGHIGEYTGWGVTGVIFTLTGMATVSTITHTIYNSSSTTTYIDMSKGYYFGSTSWMGNLLDWKILLPQDTTSVMFSINLDSITASDYRIGFSGRNQFQLVKTTTNGVVSWRAYYHEGMADEQHYDLYYNPNITDNTYQIILKNTGQSEPSTIPGLTTFYRHAEFRYIGHWTDIIGESNYYQKYDFDYTVREVSDSIDSLTLSMYHTYVRTPTMRVDAAEFKAFVYDVIENNSYEPSTFKTNPATTITNISLYGISLGFAGNTYTVDKEGRITLDSHKLPVDKLVFKSIPNSSGTYDNLIGNTLISQSATPSNISFNGKWAASVETAASESTTNTKTDWISGQFAWDGIDQNFLIIGLIAALGSFVGLAIYSRRSKTSLWPLLIVCGGAAAVFLFML